MYSTSTGSRETSISIFAQQTPASLPILLLSVASMGVNASRDSIFVHCPDEHQCPSRCHIWILLQLPLVRSIFFILHTAATGTSADCDSISAQCFDRRQRRPYLYFCTPHRRAFFLHVSTYWFLEQLYTLYWSHHHLSPAAVTTLCHPLPLSSPITWCSHHHLSFAAANITITCCSYLHLTSAAVTITYLLLQSPPSVISCRCHHLSSAAATTTCYLLPLPPPFIKSIFICRCSFVSLMRLGYTPITGHSCLPNIR